MRILFSLVILFLVACDDPKTTNNTTTEITTETTTKDTVEKVTVVKKDNKEYVVVKDESGVESLVEMMIYMQLIDQFGSMANRHYYSYSQPYYPNQYRPIVKEVHHHHYSTPKPTSSVKPYNKPYNNSNTNSYNKPNTNSYSKPYTKPITRKNNYGTTKKRSTPSYTKRSSSRRR